MNESGPICYSVTVSTDIPTAGENPPFTIYVVLTASEDEAMRAVQEVIPATWSVTNVRRTTLQPETSERLGIRPGQVHHL
jgi:hypothetical protein